MSIPLSRNLFRRRHRFIWLCFVTLAAALGTFGFVRGRSEHSIDSSAQSTEVTMPAPPLMQNAGRANPFGAEHVTLRATGFEPAEFTRPAGRFLLAIDNQTQMGEVAFRVVSDNGLPDRIFPLRPQRFRLRQMVDLLPGHYTLVVPNHPGWVCRITITAP